MTEQLLRNVVAEEVRRAVAPSRESEPEIMRAEQLARFLGVNRKTIYEYAARGVIPHQRLGRRMVFARSEVVAWLGACKESRTSKGK